MILNTKPTPIGREEFIKNNKYEMLADAETLTYDEFLDKWSNNITGVHSRIFDKWQQSPTTNWRNSIKNAIKLSTMDIKNGDMAKMTGTHIGTIYALKLGRLYVGEEVTKKLEEGLNITLYRR